MYRAERHQDGLVYVIKTIPIGELSHSEQMEAINEVKLLASIQSPYVVKYFDSFVEQETLHIVMEYCNRGDLKGLLKRRKAKNDSHLDSHRCWSLIIQIMLGLHDIHCQKVLHRDMKTANVFLSANTDPDGPRYFVKIGDLGVAKLLGTSTAFANTGRVRRRRLYFLVSAPTPPLSLSLSNLSTLPPITRFTSCSQ